MFHCIMTDKFIKTDTNVKFKLSRVSLTILTVAAIFQLNSLISAEVQLPTNE